MGCFYISIFLTSCGEVRSNAQAWIRGSIYIQPPVFPGLQERRSWKDDLYDYRKETIELLFQRIIQALGLKECQVKGEGRNGAFVLTSVWLYQICYLTNYREGKPLACIKDHLDCARWRIPSG